MRPLPTMSGHTCHTCHTWQALFVVGRHLMAQPWLGLIAAFDSEL